MSLRRAPISVTTATENGLLFDQRSGEAFRLEAHAMACSMLRPAPGAGRFTRAPGRR